MIFSAIITEYNMTAGKINYFTTTLLFNNVIVNEDTKNKKTWLVLCSNWFV